jgi:hypothetical protein
MEDKPKMGRPKKATGTLKKNRAISLTDAEYKKLQALAAEQNQGVSEFIVSHHKLAL